MSEQVNLDENIKKRKAKFFEVLIVLLISALLLYVIVNVVMNNSKVNEGKFRTIDAILTSEAFLEDTSKNTQKWSFNISQKNTLSLLINASTKDIVSAKIKNIVYNGSNSKLEVYQENYEKETVLANTGAELNLNTVINEDNSILYEINIVNKNILENFIIPEGVTEIMHDGTIFKVANLDEESIAFNISFDLEILESNGKSNIMNVKLELPQSGLIQNGSVVEKLSNSNFVFKLN